MTSYSALIGFKLDPSTAIVLDWSQVLLEMGLVGLKLLQCLLSSLSEEAVEVSTLVNFYDLEKK